MESNMNFYARLDFKKPLGEGGYGTVNRVIFKKPYKGYTEAAAKNVHRLRREEVDILQKLDHPNINKFIALYSNGPVNIILLEYAQNGSLYDYLEDHAKPLPNFLQRQWSKEAALAIQYLHRRKCLHRDIKPSNCLLSRDNTLKLCDFGLAREFDRAFILSSLKGTYQYMAPEIINTNDNNQATFSIYTDIYAYGMLLLVIYIRRSPFHGMLQPYVFYNVGAGKLQPEIPESVPKELKDMMKKCWDVNPTRRPTIDSILETLDQEALTGALQGLKIKRKSLPVRATRTVHHPNGDMVVSYLNRVHLLDGDGKYKTSLKSPETGGQRSNFIMAVALSPQGHVYIVQAGSHLIKVFSESGAYLHSFSILTTHEDPSTAVYPTDAIIDKDGNLLVTDPVRDVITIHTCPSGEITGHTGFKVKQRWPYIRGAVNSKKQILLHYTPQNAVYSRVVPIDYSGNELYSFIPKIDVDVSKGFVYPGGIVCDSDDNVFIALCVWERSSTVSVSEALPPLARPSPSKKGGISQN